MQRTFRLATVPLAALALSGLFVACSSSDDDASGDKLRLQVWVTEVCDIAVGSKADLDSYTSGLNAIDFETDDPGDIHEAVLAAFNGANGVREDIIADFNDLAEPDIEGGREVRAAFQDNFAENQDELARLIGEVEALDPEDEAYLDDLTAVFNSLDAGDTLLERLEVLARDNADVGDLITAFEDDPECANVVFRRDEAAEPTPEATPSKTATAPTSASTDTSRWVAGFCTAFASYAGDLESLGSDLQRADVQNLAQAKRAIVGIFEEARDRSQLLEDDVVALGAPDIADGEDVQGILEAAARDLVDIFDAAVDEANGLSTSDPLLFVTEVEDLTARFESAFDELGASFDELDQYDTDEIDRLSLTLPECADLN